MKNAETTAVVLGTNRLQEIKTRIAELKPLKQEAHAKSDIFEEARIISEINDLFAEQRKLEKKMFPKWKQPLFLLPKNIL